MRRYPDASGNWMRPFRSDASLPGCVRNWMRPVNGDASLPGCVRELDASSYLLSQRCVAARMRPETGCVHFAVMRRCPDAPGTGCVQSTAMRRCPDASGNWMRPVISSPSDASLPGCVRNWMRPVNGDASLPGCRPGTGCVQLSPLPAMRRCPDASGTGCVQFAAMRRCSDASGTECVQLTAMRRCPDASGTWMHPVDLLSPRCVVTRMRSVTGPATRRCTGCVQ
jgi:hypothetical protein